MKTVLSVVASGVILLVLGGCNKAESVGAEGASSSANSSESSGQVVSIIVGLDGFAPNRVELKRGSKAVLRFTRTTDKTCATTVVFPELGLSHPLPLNQPVDVAIPTDKSRTITFQCGMGMYLSKVVVL